MLDYTLLKPGDILFYRVIGNSGFLAQFIGWAQRLIGQAPSKGNYSHVVIVETQKIILEAIWPKTRRTELDLVELATRYQIEIWRVKDINDEQIQKVLQWANDHLGEFYDLLVFLLGIIDIKKAEICSTFVQKAFEAAGIELSVEGFGKRLTTPDELVNEEKLIQIK